MAGVERVFKEGLFSKVGDVSLNGSKSSAPGYAVTSGGIRYATVPRAPGMMGSMTHYDFTRDSARRDQYG